MALSLIGEAAINSFDDDSTSARLAKLRYQPARDAVLRDHPWNFAIKRASLSALTAAPDWGYDVQYQLPADCLRLLEIDNPGKEPFQVEGGKILTNLTAPISIRYVAKITAAEQFDSLFVDALAAYLAAEWAERIMGGSTAKSSELRQTYEIKLQQARSMDGQESPPVLPEESSWIDSRF